jgi:hypothetical protein
MIIIFSLGTKKLILTIIEKWNHPQILLVHERKEGHWLERRTCFH